MPLTTPPAAPPLPRPRPLRLYLSGPMTGMPDFNRPAFCAAAERLRTRGFEVVNPAEFAPRHELMSWSDWMRIGVAELSRCDGVVALPGWRDSNGARIEIGLAVQALDCPVHDETYWREIGNLHKPRAWL